MEGLLNRKGERFSRGRVPDRNGQGPYLDQVGLTTTKTWMARCCPKQARGEGFQEQERRLRPSGCCFVWVGGDEKRSVKLTIVDVNEAHLKGRLKDSEFAYVSIPRGGWRWSGEVEPVVVRLAASAWKDDYAEHPHGETSSRGRSSPLVMPHEGRRIRLVVWCDDFTFLGFDLK